MSSLVHQELGQLLRTATSLLADPAPALEELDAYGERQEQIFTHLATVELQSAGERAVCA